MSYSYDFREKTAAKSPTLLESSVDWVRQLGKALASYFKSAGGGWSKIRPKVNLRDGFRGVRAELEGRGWSGTVTMQVQKGALKVTAFGDLTGEVSSDFDPLDYLSKATPSFEKVYPDDTHPEKIISDLSLYYSGIVEPLT